MEADKQWNGEAIKGMKGTPQRPNPLKAGNTIPVRIRFDPLPVAMDGTDQEELRSE